MKELRFAKISQIADSFDKLPKELCFQVSSLVLSGQVIISDTAFALFWAIALVAVAIWAWQRNRRWVLNTVAIFGGIHFYTQWFENLGASPGTVFIAGLLALGFAVGLKSINTRIKAA